MQEGQSNESPILPKRFRKNAKGIDIIGDILRNCIEPLKVTTIESKLSLSSASTAKYVNLAENYKLLATSHDKSFYMTTHKGFAFLGVYDELHELQKKVNVKQAILEALLDRDDQITSTILNNQHFEDSMRNQLFDVLSSIKSFES
jgi:predicted transcriptional regulator